MVSIHIYIYIRIMNVMSDLVCYACDMSWNTWITNAQKLMCNSVAKREFLI